VSDGFTPNEQFVRYIITRTSYIRRDDVRFVLDQHAFVVLAY